MEDTSGRASLSKTMSWPRRGAMVNSSWPKRRLRRSAPSPAALTTQSARIGPSEVCSSHPSTVAPDIGDVRAEPELDAGADRFGGEGDARAPRADDRFVGDGDGPRRPCGQVRLAPGEFVEVHPGGAFVPVGPGLGQHVVEPRRLLRVPGHQDGPGLLERDPARPRVGRSAARDRGGPGRTPGFRAACRSRCAQWRCWPSRCRCRHRRRARAARCAADSGPVGDRWRCRPPRPR